MKRLWHQVSFSSRVKIWILASCHNSQRSVAQPNLLRLTDRPKALQHRGLSTECSFLPVREKSTLMLQTYTGKKPLRSRDSTPSAGFDSGSVHAGKSRHYRGSQRGTDCHFAGYRCHWQSDCQQRLIENTRIDRSHFSEKCSAARRFLDFVLHFGCCYCSFQEEAEIGDARLSDNVILRRQPKNL